MVRRSPLALEELETDSSGVIVRKPDERGLPCVLGRNGAEPQQGRQSSSARPTRGKDRCVEPSAEPEATLRDANANANAERASTRETVRLVAQVVVPLGVVFLGVSMAAALFRPQLRVLGEGFVHRFGYAGMALGAFVSDAFNFPIPPQFYMLTAVAAGAPQIPSVTVVCVSSVIAANVAYFVAGSLAKVPFIAHRIEASRPRIDPLFAKYGYYAVAIGAMLPIPFSLLCYVAGLYKVPYRIYVVLVLMRVPRLLAFYALIRLGWG